MRHNRYYIISLATILKSSVVALALLALLLTGGCASSPSPHSTAALYRVSPGDTLSLIAQRHNVSVADLVHWNDLDSADFIVVGQRLRLSGQAPSVDSVPKAPTRVATTSRKTIPHKQRRANWQWPVKGQVTSTYKPRIPGRHGILIQGQRGAVVKAAYEGRVIYSGSGALGQGYMLIVKHDDHTISAYSHLTRVNVRQGQQVRAGQTIAELSPTQKTNLHFEVRHRGKTVNPLLYLT